MNNQKHHNKIRRFRYIFPVIVLLCFTMALFQADPKAVSKLKEKNKFNAVSANPGFKGKTDIILYWNLFSGYKGFNIYRKVKGSGSFPDTPVNGKKLIAMVKTCEELKAIVPEGSPEWEMLRDALNSLNLEEHAGDKTKPGLSPGFKVDKKLLGNLSFVKALAVAKSFSVVKTDAVKTVSKPIKPVMTPAKPAVSVDLSDMIAKIDPSIFKLIHDPCFYLSRGLTDKEMVIFDMLAATSLKFRQVRGIAFIDKEAQAGVTYTYELRGVLRHGKEEVLFSPVDIKAGVYILPAPPSGFTVSPGDRKALALWDRNANAYGYTIQRSDFSGGSFHTINDKAIIFDIESDLNGAALSTPRPGFVDFQRWDEDGNPVSRTVNGITFEGPLNNTTYYYRVAGSDILGRMGGWSDGVPVSPVDSTSPSVPVDFKVDQSKTPAGLALSWRKSTRDINSHVEQDITQTYKIYRSDIADQLNTLAPNGSLPAANLIHTMTATVADTATITLSWIDTDPVLFPAFGEKDFYYRVQCVDTAGNVSAPSALIVNRAPDVTPPGPTHVTGSEGYADHITIRWDPNTEPDLAGYQVYRGICDKGRPYQPLLRNEKPLPCDFVLIGEIMKEEAEKRKAETGSIFYDDYSVDPGSAVCYSYWVRAFDKSRNLYMGNYGCPVNSFEYVCQKVYEEVAPPPPIISGLRAQNDAVKIDWISSPIQDLKAFHVYRSDSETGDPEFVACVFIDGTVSSTKWEGVKPKCDDIPAVLSPLSTALSYTDKKVEPHVIYWYRVSALDWLGNESNRDDISKIPAISTFTYSKDLPDKPFIISVAPSPSGECGVLVRWNPTFDPSRFSGFLVYRSSSLAGPYRQVSPLVKENEFIDLSCVPGKSYWYRVQSVDLSGKLSEPSLTVKYDFPPK